MAGTDPGTQEIQRRDMCRGVYRLTKQDADGDSSETVMHGESLEDIVIYVHASRHDWTEIRDDVTGFLLWEKATGLDDNEDKGW